jgi:hypothetical protein
MKQKKKRFQVRFHLGKGANYMCWQVKDNRNKGVEYYAPSNVSLELTNCTLRNSVPTAMKIFNGQSKTVCAWVECDMIDVHYKKSPSFSKPNIRNMDKYKYNPKKHMHWFTKRNNNADNKDLKKMHTNNRALYGQVSKISTQHIE